MGMNVEGLRVDIYKSGGRSFDNGRFSSKVEEATVVASPDFPDVEKVFSSDEVAPAVAIVKRMLLGEVYLTAYPVVNGRIDRECMSGGCFVYSCDSRFRRISQYPVPLHDRKE